METLITTATDGQKKQVKRFVEDAVDRAIAEGLLDDKDATQNLIENGDELQLRVIAAIRELSLMDQFANEEVQSAFGYLSGYKKPKSIPEQVAILRELFPELKDATFDEQVAASTLPDSAKGYFAIPRWELIASTYGEAVEKVLTKISHARNGAFHNYRNGQLGPEYLCQHTKTVAGFQQLGEEQKGHNILVVAGQFGLRHRGRSVRRAREVMNSQEFGLGAFAIGIMLLTHPERLQHYDDLWIDCGGDEYAPNADGVFFRAPYFRFHDGQVKFDSHDVDDALGDYGSASAFLPQQLMS